MATVKYYYKHNETTQIYYFIILQFRSLTMRLTSRFSSTASLWISLGGIHALTHLDCWQVSLSCSSRTVVPISWMPVRYSLTIVS